MALKSSKKALFIVVVIQNAALGICNFLSISFPGRLSTSRAWDQNFKSAFGENPISDAADIFQLKEGDIAVLERFGEKSAQNIISETKSCQIISLPRFIYSLGNFTRGRRNQPAFG